MKEQNEDYLKWDYDYKEKLLDKNKYERDPKYAIKNILKAQIRKNYVKNHTGHIENYDNINKIFKTVFHLNDNELEYKDVMNSFWHTYKFYLQLEYPAIFMPEGDLRDESGSLTKPRSNVLTKVNIGYPPHTNSYIHKKYIDYYKDYFGDINISDHKDQNKILWTTFLIENFEKFNKVHENKYLNDFAKLTHTIGNIAVVPKGFNAGRHNYDYWDYALCDLKEFLYSISAWDNFVKKYFLEDYVCHSCSNILSFWEKHLISENILPKNKEQIDLFLITVNQRIENRGKRIMNTYNKLASPKTNL